MSRARFLSRLTPLLADDPCLVPKADLLRLLAMAGLAGSSTFSAVKKAPDLVSVDPGELRTLIQSLGGAS